MDIRILALNMSLSFMYFLGIISILAAVFLLMAGLVWIVCWGFSVAFSWKIVMAIWALMIIFKIF